MSRDVTTALDVLNAAKMAISFTQGMDSATFAVDPKSQSAVLHQLLILGEAVKRLSDAFRADHPELPWKLMAGMRDQLFRNYDSTDLVLVWETLQKDIPEVIAILSRVLESE